MKITTHTIRPPSVAGKFYPASATELRRVVDNFMTQAPPPGAAAAKAVVAPHAGYIYSGPIAAAAFTGLIPGARQIKRVVLLSPSHRLAFDGLALCSADAWSTPLGPVRVDAEVSAALEALPQVAVLDEAHEYEHGLEVELPFLQVVLEDFAIVPLVVGKATDVEVAEVLERVWGEADTCCVISTDLSHYLDYEQACAMDALTARAVARLDPQGIGPQQACGRIPLRGLLRVAHQRQLRAELLDLRNSGDTAGSRDRVVGYGAWAFFESGK